MYPALILHYGRLSRRTIYFLAILLRETWPSGMKEIVLIRRGGDIKPRCGGRLGRNAELLEEEEEEVRQLQGKLEPPW